MPRRSEKFKGKIGSACPWRTGHNPFRRVTDSVACVNAALQSLLRGGREQAGREPVRGQLAQPYAGGAALGVSEVPALQGRDLPVHLGGEVDDDAPVALVCGVERGESEAFA